ncbi:MAG: hypothetical protein IJX46_07475, partial [Clostridia bacterium]|nr:hypothetical protein [Clostridia bacterium]
VCFENIRVLTDSDEMRPLIKVKCEGGSDNISGISLSGLYLNGEKQTDLSRFETVFENFYENIIKN